MGSKCTSEHQLTPHFLPLLRRPLPQGREDFYLCVMCLLAVGDESPFQITPLTEDMSADVYFASPTHGSSWTPSPRALRAPGPSTLCCEWRRARHPGSLFGKIFYLYLQCLNLLGLTKSFGLLPPRIGNESMVTTPPSGLKSLSTPTRPPAASNPGGRGRQSRWWTRRERGSPVVLVDYRR